ncbi:TetR/AcrR family transcriptional regulator [Pseudaestuariivita rosea]|uniref:TetR/AcrR family transcriptional regulator n=1 Tax=Pseudaestuariivita rosea TaxID=2763263 RepID=UPI001ABA2CB3|nr:TetR/AcrR family transcriptional regulator [Pseudaestuariivita rosea]
MARKQGSHSEITGPRVHSAALRLFAQHGFAAVSMRQIASDVGVQAGALYNYTPDKQSLLFDLMKGHMDELLAAHSQADISGDPLQRLEAFTRFHIDFHLERPDHVFISYMELRNLTTENFTVIEELRRTYENALETILRDGAARRVFVLNDTKITALALIAMLTGVTSWYRATGRLTQNEVADLYWELVKNTVGA